MVGDSTITFQHSDCTGAAALLCRAKQCVPWYNDLITTMEVEMAELYCVGIFIMTLLACVALES